MSKFTPQCLKTLAPYLYRTIKQYNQSHDIKGFQLIVDTINHRGD